MADEAIRPQADGVILEFRISDFLEVFFRNDPARPCRWCAIKGEEIRPGFMQLDANVMGIDHLDRLHLRLQLSSPRPLVAFEAELHIFGGKGVAVMKLHPLAQLELIG